MPNFLHQVKNGGNRVASIQTKKKGGKTIKKKKKEKNVDKCGCQIATIRKKG